MPLIRCSKCGQAYDVPGVIAVRLPNAIATCHCGEWLAGSKAAVLARLLNPEQIKEIDLQPYRVETTVGDETSLQTGGSAALPSAPRSIRVIDSGAREAINQVYTIHEYPLWIGSRDCHIEFPAAELSIRHCSISVQGNQLVLRDADSHMGTFLDGTRIQEAVIDDGIHLVRAGAALLSLEPTQEPGTPVGPVVVRDTTVDERQLHEIQTRSQPPPPGSRVVLVCIGGSLNGQEFEIPPTGLTVGREGHVRVPDEFLSRKHFEVLPDEEGAVRVRDLGSRNGTFLNTLPAKNTKVMPGDEIRAGVNRFRIEYRT